jgi:hypothetical protein
MSVVARDAGPRCERIGPTDLRERGFCLAKTPKSLPRFRRAILVQDREMRRPTSVAPARFAACLATLAACAGKPPPAVVIPRAAPATAEPTSSAPPLSSTAERCYAEEVERALTACPKPSSTAPSLEAIASAWQEARMIATQAPTEESGTYAPRALTSTDTRALDLARAHRCATTNGGGDPEVAFARALLYFERRHWAEAAVLFEKIALAPEENPRPHAQYAAQLWLEAVKVLAFGAPRKKREASPERACAVRMTSNIERFWGLFCTPVDAGKLRPRRTGSLCWCVCGDPLCACGDDEPCVEMHHRYDDFCPMLGRMRAELEAPIR